MIPPRVRTRACVTVAGLLLAAGAGGCTGDREAAPVPPGQPTPSTASVLKVRPGPLKVRIVNVGGSLPGSVRADVRRRLRSAIGSWMSAGFTGGDHPRPDFSQAFGGYTPGAARLARRQRSVTTNVRLAGDLIEVVPTRRVAQVSVLEVSRRAVGASAQVLLVVVGARADGSRQELVVNGELDLAPTGQGWKIFGFDLQRSVGSPGAYAAARREARRERRAERRDRTRNRPRTDRTPQ